MNFKRETHLLLHLLVSVRVQRSGVCRVPGAGELLLLARVLLGGESADVFLLGALLDLEAKLGGWKKRVSLSFLLWVGEKAASHHLLASLLLLLLLPGEHQAALLLSHISGLLALPLLSDHRFRRGIEASEEL